MTSDQLPQDTALEDDPPNPSEPEERVIGGRATPEEIYLIDRACLELRVKRGPFVVAAAVKAAQAVLEEQEAA